MIIPILEYDSNMKKMTLTGVSRRAREGGGGGGGGGCFVRSASERWRERDVL